MHVPRARRRGKRDRNHGPIVKALTKAGRRVVELDGVGNGVPDLLVGWPGGVVFLEVKNPEGRDRVEPSQTEFARWWLGCPVFVVHSETEALAATGIRL